MSTSLRISVCGDFQFVVVRLEAPRVVHRHARFPVDAGQARRRDLLLGRAEVAGLRRAACSCPACPSRPLPTRLLTMIVGLRPRTNAYSRGRRSSVHQSIHSPSNQSTLGVVVRQQLLQLRLQVARRRRLKLRLDLVLAVAGRRVLAGPVDELRRVVPVHDRVVEAELQALLLRHASASSRIGSVLERRGVDDVLVADLRCRTWQKPSWCLRGDDDVLHARVASRSAPIRRASNFTGLNCGASFSYSASGMLAHRHDPLADVLAALAVPLAGRHGVEAPVDEHAEARLAPPGHAGVVLRRRFTWRLSGVPGANRRDGEEREQDGDDRAGEWGAHDAGASIARLDA